MFIIYWYEMNDTKNIQNVIMFIYLSCSLQMKLMLELDS